MRRSYGWALAPLICACLLVACSSILGIEGIPRPAEDASSDSPTDGTVESEASVESGVQDVATVDGPVNGCIIGGALVTPSSVNPNDPCQVCLPSKSTSAWSSVANGMGCGNGQVCASGACGTQCDIGGTLVASGGTNPGNHCQSCQPGTSTSAWTNDAPGTSCGSATICNAGACAAGCFIGGAIYAASAINQANACQSCQPATSTMAWTTASDGVSCGAGQVCSLGSCAAGCFIGGDGGTFYSPATIDTASACQSCQPASSTTVWTVAGNGASCGGAGSCTAGACACSGSDAGAALCSPDGGDQYCAGTTSDSNNCGACGNVCGQGGKTSCCSSNCVDQQSNPLNCGACKHSCLGGACVAGMCQPFALVTGLPAAATPLWIALDAMNVYWTDNGANTVMQCAIGGCGTSPTTVASAQNGPNGVAVDASNVYWTNPPAGTVMKAPIGGGTATTLASAQVGPNFITAGNGSVYWTDNAPGFASTATVMSCNPGSCTSTLTTLASGRAGPMGIVVDSKNVYWAEFGLNASDDGAVLQCPIAGCGAGGSATITLASGAPENNPLGIAVDSKSVYWTNENVNGPTDAMSCTIDGCGNAPTTLGSPMTGTTSPYGIAVDSTYVYWGTRNTGATLFRSLLAGGGTTTFAPGQCRPQAVAVDSTSIYWATNCVPAAGGGVWRLAK